MAEETADADNVGETERDVERGAAVSTAETGVATVGLQLAAAAMPAQSRKANEVTFMMAMM